MRKGKLGISITVCAAIVALGLLSAGSAFGQRGDLSAAPTRVALVTDIGGLNDKGFNALANKGLEDAKKRLGVQGRVLISRAAGDYVPNLSTAARQGFDLVIANGFLMGDAVAAVAKRFPDTSFAIIDFPSAALRGKPKNARGIVFAENEGGYLAGVAAASVTKSGVVSSVGGQSVPAVVAFLAGYRAGVKATKPSAAVLSARSETFTDQARCKEIALDQLDRRSDVIFQAAGGCGLGALQAAKERGMWGIGVDNDQSFLGSFILTSATKKVDVAVFEVIRQVRDGTFRGGTDAIFNVKNKGIGYGRVSARAPRRAALIRALDAASKAIAAGKVRVPRK